MNWPFASEFSNVFLLPAGIVYKVVIDYMGMYVNLISYEFLL